jgi:hypothetical protein
MLLLTGCSALAPVNIEVNATGTLDAKASGASTVRYTGSPTLGRIDESGASTISSQ